jgi:hypothetical protein
LAVLLVVATACSGSHAGDSGTGPSPATGAPPSTTMLPPPAAHYRRPPQFVMVSFDGSGDPKLWRHWRAVGARTGARFSFFLSGVYLLDPAQRRLYHPPRHSAGSSDIGFSPSAAAVRALVRQIDLGYAEGHEIGTHYNGHFCQPYPGNVGTWSRSDWRREIGQFHKLMRHARLAVPDSEIRGGRTPCLQGHLARLYPVLRSQGMTYDASQAGLPGD